MVLKNQYTFSSLIFQIKEQILHSIVFQFGRYNFKRFQSYKFYYKIINVFVSNVKN